MWRSKIETISISDYFTFAGLLPGNLLTIIIWIEIPNPNHKIDQHILVFRS